MSTMENLREEASQMPFPRGNGIPMQSPLFWVTNKDRYLRQLLIRDIEEITKRSLVVYFANRFRTDAGIDDADPMYMAELFHDIPDEAPVDLLIETNGGKTDSTEGIVSILRNKTSDFRVIVARAAKSNGTLICLAGKSIVMGAQSELGPIDPHLQGAPCTVLAQPTFVNVNLMMHELAKLALRQTQKLASTLLSTGMMRGADQARIEKTVQTLATRDTYFSHGSAIDYKEALSIGLSVEYLPPDDELWQRIWLLYSMYEFDIRKNDYIKIFEGSRLSTAIEGPYVAEKGV